MKLVAALALLTVAAVPATAQPTAFCPYGQACNGRPAVPFPVISPVQGLANVLGPNQQKPLPPPVAYAPIATPPPVLPPGTSAPTSP